MMNLPLGRVTQLRYEDKQPSIQMDTSVLVVEFRAPDADYYEHSLPNQQYMVQCPALQLMALNNFKPSDIKGTSMDTEDWRWTLPLAVAEDGSYQLHSTVLDGGEAALREAEWFEGRGSSNGTESSQTANGSSSDPSTGNQGSVDIKEAADDDVGVEIVVE